MRTGCWGHGYAAAAEDARDAVRRSAELLAAKGPIGTQHTSVGDATRHVTSVIDPGHSSGGMACRMQRKDNRYEDRGSKSRNNSGEGLQKESEAEIRGLGPAAHAQAQICVLGPSCSDVVMLMLPTKEYPASRTTLTRSTGRWMSTGPPSTAGGRQAASRRPSPLPHGAKEAL